MTSLSHQFDSLCLGNGQPDVEARRRELDNLIASLSASDIRHLQTQLSGITLQKDICGQLPIELLLCVAEHMSLEDVLKGRSVSRRWNKMFTSFDFCVGLVKIHFRQVWERSFRHAVSRNGHGSKLTLLEWLPGAIRKRIKRLQGIFDHEDTSTYKLWQTPNGISERHPVLHYPQYCAGRLAFKLNRSTIVVKNLYLDALDETYRDENLVSVQRWLLSDSYLVVQFNSTTLLAWFLGSFKYQNPSKIRLPNQASKLSACKDQVAILTYTQEVLIWQIGAQLKSLNTSNLLNQASEMSLIGVEFHPDHQGHIFVVALARIRPGNVKVYIQESWIGGPDKFHYLEIDFPDYNTIPLPKLIDLGEGSIGVATLDPDQPSEEQKVAANQPPHTQPVFKLLQFDLYTKEFKTSTHQYAKEDMLGVWKSLFWRDTMQSQFQDGKEQYLCVRGDDDTVVYFGEKEYKVLTFKEKITHVTGA